MMGVGVWAKMLRKSIFMFKSKESENEVVWRVRLMDKVDTLGIELRLIKFLIVMVCLFDFVNMLLNCTRRV